MPERIIRARIPIRIWRWLEAIAWEFGYEDSEELLEELLIALHHQHGGNTQRRRRRKPPQPPAAKPAN